MRVDALDFYDILTATRDEILIRIDGKIAEFKAIPASDEYIRGLQLARYVAASLPDSVQVRTLANALGDVRKAELEQDAARGMEQEHVEDDEDAQIAYEQEQEDKLREVETRKWAAEAAREEELG